MPFSFDKLPSSSQIVPELEKAGDRALCTDRTEKQKYAQRLSNALALRFANELRSRFKGIKPDQDGRGQESPARTAKRVKKLDVNYSTAELGLGLGVSLKTINFSDQGSSRYTKNYTRVDGELRAEASDFHERQPYAVMIAVVFIPLDTCNDGINGPSSFGSCVRVFRYRAGREDPKDDSMLFERVFIGLYDTDEATNGRVGFFDVMNAPPKRGRPASLISFAELVAEIVSTYDARNSPPFHWAEGEVEETPEPPAVEIDTDE
ncbi:hypothetical protein ACQR1W_10300 [Bradyrhizobium sp. HKCCYLS1011]|uniref:hypothetical protein n=1 Tax=Bradyrhizobium sp. HKCCYLS1011 TaxID=3420733 RepID=UPI003EB6D97C